ncbi:MAG: PDZ domain-containing protein [Solirubrobacterales bacterium]|nr:PDZ domain-containing protein [Solirubrobacterales bacterium]
MTGPRHLWSGDWQLESSAHAEELAARRPHAAEPTQPTQPTEPTEPTQPRVRRPRRRFASGRTLRLGAAVVLVALLTGGAAYAVASTLTGSDRTPPAAAAAGGQPWLGVEMSSSPIGGAMVDRVIPGSPAEAAGIKPGDVITQIDTEPVAAPSIVSAAIAGLQPGDQVDIQLQRGPNPYTAHVTLASRPAGYP